MSFHFWGMAVRAEREDVLHALRDWPTKESARLEPCAGSDVEHQEGWVAFALRTHGPWTVFLFFFSQRVIPDLAVHLSRALRTRVISVDQNEQTGYQHFSVVDDGTLVRLFTAETEVIQNVGVDTMDFYEKAKRSGKLRLRPLASPDDEKDESELMAFRIFNVVVSDINVEDICADIDAEQETGFRLWAGEHEDSARMRRGKHFDDPRWTV